MLLNMPGRASGSWCALIALAAGTLMISASCQQHHAASPGPAGQVVGGAQAQNGQAPAQTQARARDAEVADHARAMIDDGRRTFRSDTFGSEDFWGQTGLHAAIEGERLGGVGPGVSPRQALALGLKVDADAVPPSMAQSIRNGTADLDDPATTLALFKANAVIGVKGFFTPDQKQLRAVGIQCALCHSTVDDSFSAGIGHRLDGWPNRDLDVGKIIASAPDLSAFSSMLQVDDAEVRRVFRAWGPGKYDASLSMDGKGFRPDGETAAVLIPAAYGMAGVNNHTWAGVRGSVPYWNAYVAVTQMHGKGTFIDPRLNNAEQFPVAARTGQGDLREGNDQVSGKLPALHLYQIALPIPRPPAGAFDPVAARRGERLFNGTARCAQCHVPPVFSEPGWNLHDGKEIGIDDFQSSRTPGNQYRTAPLRALWDTEKAHKGGFYHDGRFQTLEDVVDHYQDVLNLRIDDRQKQDLVEYLKSI